MTLWSVCQHWRVTNWNSGPGRWRLVLDPGQPAAAGAYAPVEAVVKLAP